MVIKHNKTTCFPSISKRVDKVVFKMISNDDCTGNDQKKKKNIFIVFRKNPTYNIFWKKKIVVNII